MNQAFRSHSASRSLVLASSSAYRRALLKRFRVPFDWYSPDIDERRMPAEQPARLVRRLAEAKAEALVARFPEALIIGGDQVAARGNEVFGKPGSVAVAEHQLRQASSRELTFFTGVAVLDASNGRVISDVVPVTVAFRSLTNAEISAYIAAEQPLDCAGSFKCEGLGISLFERIDSNDPTALTGLPLIALNRLLREHGFDVLDAAST